MATFDAQVDAWVKKSAARMEAVFKQSAQEVIAAMQEVGPSVANPTSYGRGNMPVDTGFLRASLKTTLNSPALDFRENPGTGLFDWALGEASLTINGAKLGDTVYAVYTANYARHVEYGTRGRAGRRFVALAAARWPAIVAKVANEAKLRSGG